MYNAYGNSVYKKYQVHMGNPYQVKPKRKPVREEKPAVDTKPNPEEEAKAIIEKAREEAAVIIENANREAAEILQEAQEKVTTHMLEIEQQAKEEGYRHGETLARQHYQSLIDEAEDLKQQVQKAYESTVVSLESDIVETILDISRKVIGVELQQNRDVILGLVQTALLGSSPTGEVVVRVSPEDYDYVQENKEALLQHVDDIRDIAIKKDGVLKKGGCLVETGYGSIDSSIETQLAGIERSFQDLMGDSSSNKETTPTDDESV